MLLSRLSDTIVVPPIDKKAGLVRFGVFDRDGRAVTVPPIFFASRSNNALPLKKLGKDINIQTSTPGHFFWGGLFDIRFGHWITETVPMLVSLAENLQKYPDSKVAMLYHRRCSSEEGLRNPNSIPFVDFFLRKLGIAADRLHIIRSPEQLEALTVLPPILLPKGRYSDDLPNQIEDFGFPNFSGGPERILIKKSEKSGLRQRIKNFSEIENFFMEKGYETLEPEKLSLSDQIALMRSVRVLAGESGSALHWSLYSNTIEHVISLGWKLRLQRSICQIRSQKLHQVRSPITGAFKGRYQNVPVSVVRAAVEGAG